MRKSAVDAVVAAYKAAGSEVMDLLQLSDSDPQGSQMLKTVREAVATVEPPAGKAKAKGRPAAKFATPAKAKSPVASPAASPPQSPRTPSTSPTPAASRTVVKARGPASKSPASKSPTPSSRSPQPHDEVADKTCIFCGKFDKTFDTAGMDVHFWKSCPMLKQCKHCKQVVEVSMLREHWLGECSAKIELKTCPKCKMPKPAADLAEHKAKGACHPPKAGHVLCPLCQADVKDGEEGWKAHLLGGKCTFDARSASARPSRSDGAAIAITVGGTPSAASREEMLKVPTRSRSPSPSRVPSPSPTPKAGAAAAASSKAKSPLGKKAASEGRDEGKKGKVQSPSPTAARAGSRSPAALEGKTSIPRAGKR